MNKNYVTYDFLIDLIKKITDNIGKGIIPEL